MAHYVYLRDLTRPLDTAVSGIRIRTLTFSVDDRLNGSHLGIRGAVPTARMLTAFPLILSRRSPLSRAWLGPAPGKGNCDEQSPT